MSVVTRVAAVEPLVTVSNYEFGENPFEIIEEASPHPHDENDPVLVTPEGFESTPTVPQRTVTTTRRPRRLGQAASFLYELQSIQERQDSWYLATNSTQQDKLKLEWAQLKVAEVACKKARLELESTKLVTEVQMQREERKMQVEMQRKERKKQVDTQTEERKTRVERLEIELAVRRKDE